MVTTNDDGWDDNYSSMGDDPKVEVWDFDEQKSVSDFDLDDEGPITISFPFPFVGGKPQSALIGETKAHPVILRNTTNEPIELWAVRIHSSNPEGSYTLSLMEPPSAEADEESVTGFLESSSLEDRILQPNQTLTIWLSCKPKEIGLHTSIIHFVFDADKIEQIIFLLAEDKVSQSLASRKPYFRPSRKQQFSLNSDQYVSAPRPDRSNAHYKHFLPKFPVPPEIRAVINSKQIPNVVKEGLTNDNYANYFTNLLIMEEIHLEEDMRQYDIMRVTMSRRGKYLALEVPGLAEKRPSLVTGDSIFVKLSNEDSDGSVTYQGSIHRVEADEVFLKFRDEFHGRYHEKQLYNVAFTFDRLTMRRCYHAVKNAQKILGPEYLFPSKRRVIKTTPFVAFNRNLNEEQLSSVEMIVGCQGAPPYVIHGPPGTGKTVTLVEAILQLYNTRRGRNGARILVCAASNSAADHILERLIDKKMFPVKQNEIFRLNAASRAYEDVRSDILQYCFFDDMVFKSPPLLALLHYKIVISTYMSTSLLCGEGIRQGHFSHIFLDEAGQASEPETMIPMANLCRKETVVVLAGDPMQLGPVIFSKESESFGLGKSYLERLFESELYSSEDENFVTKLVRNYRCHPAILKLPSKLFYKGELMACKEERDSSLSEWEGLPNKEFPVLYVGIQGCDEREGCNPSWFNRIEASKVIEIINRLMESTDVDEEDIGIITPYRQQVVKLKQAFEAFDMEGLKVGSVEQFQGQEKRVIIISTVRSTVMHNEFDTRHNLGFLSNPRRFNVAITRAKSLLIIVGNPHIITKDPYWDTLLRYCSDNNSYEGCPLPPSEMNSFIDEGIRIQIKTGGEEVLKPLSEEGDWRGGSSKAEEIPKPVANSSNWADNSRKLSKVSREGKSGEGFSKAEEIPKYVANDGDSAEDSWKLSKVSEEGKQCEDCCKTADILTPVYDESQWESGWLS